MSNFVITSLCLRTKTADLYLYCPFIQSVGYMLIIFAVCFMAHSNLRQNKLHIFKRPNYHKGPKFFVTSGHQVKALCILNYTCFFT